MPQFQIRICVRRAESQPRQLEPIGHGHAIARLECCLEHLAHAIQPWNIFRQTPREAMFVCHGFPHQQRIAPLRQCGQARQRYTAPRGTQYREPRGAITQMTRRLHKCDKVTNDRQLAQRHEIDAHSIDFVSFEAGDNGRRV